MRALRILLIVAGVLGVLFVIVDRVAVNLAEGEVGDRLRTTENLADTPEVSIHGFPFLTQLAGGELDDVEVGMGTYEAATGSGGEKVRIDGLTARMRGVGFAGDYSSATAATVTGTATIAYDELLKTAESKPTRVAPGVTAKVVGLSDGGNGKIKVEVEATLFGTRLPEPVFVLSTVRVEDNTVRVDADSLPKIGGVALPESQVREITDFEQRIEDLPGGIEVDKVEPAGDGVQISVKGSDVRLAG